MRLVTKLALFLALGLASAFPAGAQTLDALANFNPDAGAPKAKLLLASDGYLYGTTSAGGHWGRGSIFRILPNGTGFEVVFSFLDYEGIGPAAELIEYAGSLYGTARGGGDFTTGSGTVFRIQLPIGSGIEVVHQFNKSGGAAPAGLLELNGIFYGTTESGGAYEQGTVFSLDPSTSPATFSLLHSFGQGGTFASPNGALVAVGGMLYGTTTFGGPNNGGTVFRISPDGTQFGIVANDADSPPARIHRRRWRQSMGRTDHRLRRIALWRDAGRRHQRRRRVIPPAVRFGRRQRARPDRQLSGSGQSVGRPTATAMASETAARPTRFLHAP